MEGQMRRTGIEVIGNAPWGTHFCQFYQTKQGLIDILVPYFRQGLADNEFCMWITSEPLGVDEAKAALRSVVPALDEYIRKGQLEILDYTQWYTRNGKFDVDEVLRGWVEKLEGALDRGYEGLRLTGNTFWLEGEDWADFTAYEEAVNRVIGRYRMLAICTYSLTKCDAREVINVVCNHRYVLVKRDGRWQMIESSEHQKTEAGLQKTEERFRLAAAATNDAIWDCDLLTDTIWWNEAYDRLFGARPPDTAGSWQWWIDRIHPDDRDRVLRSLTTARDGAAAEWMAEYRFRRADSGWAFVLDRAHISRDASGQAVRVLGAVLDLTERRRAEEENRAAVELLRLVNESKGTDDLAYAATEFFQRTSGCKAVGIRLKRRYDYPYYGARGFPEGFTLPESGLCPRDEEGRPVRDSTGNPAFECMCGNVICGRFDPSKPFFTTRGSFWTNSTTDLLASMTEADGQVCIRDRCCEQGCESVALIPLCVGEDRLGLLQLCDRRRERFTLENIALWERLADHLAVGISKYGAEETLRESQERLKRTQEIAHLGSWELDLVKNELTWSDEVYHIFGLQPQEFDATYEAFLKHVHPDDRAAVDTAYSGSIREGRDAYEIEHRVVRKDTDEIAWVQERCQHVRDAEGRIVRSRGMVLDITERKRAEDALRLERDKLRAVIDNINVGIGIIDPNGTTVSVNAEGLRIHGFGSEAEIFARLDHYADEFELHYPDGRTMPLEEWPTSRAMRGQYVRDYEAILSRRGRHEPRIVSYSVAPIYDSQGTVALHVFNMLDLTDRKRAEEVLRQYAERLRLLHEVDEAIVVARSAQEVAEAVVQRIPRVLPCLHASAVILDPETRELGLLATYSRSGQSELDQGWPRLTDAAWDPVLEQLVQGHDYVIDDLQALPPSSPLIAQLQAEGVRAQVYEPIPIHGRFTGLVVLDMDAPGPLSCEQREVIHELVVQLTAGLEQARLDEEVQRYAGELEQLVQLRTAALEASEARFRAIFEQASIGIALANHPGEGLMATNPALQRLLGHSDRELAGLCLFDLLPGADGEGGSLLADLVAGQRSEYALELQYARRDGEPGQAYVTVSLMQGDTDESSLLLALVDDITERKRAQEALIQAERLAVVGRMAASLAHEINNPIQSVIGCLDLAMEVMEEGEDPARFLDVAMEELERTARIVHRMRDLSRHEDARKEPASVGELVETVLTLTQKRAQNQQVEVILEAGEQLPPVSMVRDHIRQVFLNLVLNAMDAMPQGGELRVRAARTEDSPGVQVCFADTGEGIPPEEVDRLFEAFFSTKQGGLGLGLHVSHNIVQDHGGRIDVKSEVGQGTTFTVWLPAQQ
jgi:PAS domain S-box-containing protein